MNQRPRIPIPPAQTARQKGSWAYYTLGERFRETAQRVIIENNFSESVEKRLHGLIAEIPNSSIRPFSDPGSPDADAWEEYLEPYIGMNWRQLPWLTSEHYFYRRILAATGFFQPGEGFELDPFSRQKKQGLRSSERKIQHLLEKFNHGQEWDVPSCEIVRQLLFVNLWGNQADLSLWPAESDSKPDHQEGRDASDYLLMDESAAVMELIRSGSLQQVDFLIDNAGFELVTDLVYADTLLVNETADTVHFHLKQHPTYVSDATRQDVEKTVDYFMHNAHLGSQGLGQRLQQALQMGRLVLKTGWFWNSPLVGWEMPANIRQDLSESSLVISKGDAHYRRLLGDRHWSYDTCFADVLSYFPAPLVVLRTLKSELVVGLTTGRINQIYATDRNWLINGRWGMVQFIHMDR